MCCGHERALHQCLLYLPSRRLIPRPGTWMTRCTWLTHTAVELLLWFIYGTSQSHPKGFFSTKCHAKYVGSRPLFTLVRQNSDLVGGSVLEQYVHGTFITFLSHLCEMFCWKSPVYVGRKNIQLSFEYLHVYSPKSCDFAGKNSKIAPLLSFQRSDLWKILKYSHQSWNLEGIRWIFWIYKDAAPFAVTQLCFVTLVACGGARRCT